jgi:hypothetical protein
MEIGSKPEAGAALTLVVPAGGHGRNDGEGVTG